MRSFVSVFTIITLSLAACADPAGGPDSVGETNDTADVLAGQTAIVAIVNPVVNTPHNTGVPGTLSDVTEGVLVDAEPGGDELTVDGLAVVRAEPGPVDVLFDGVGISHAVTAAGDVIDMPVGFNGDDVEYFDNTPIRYAVGEGSGALFFDDTHDLRDIEDALGEDEAIVVLGPGEYIGDIVITGERVLLFGEGWSDNSVLIDGSLTANGNGVRLRGLAITGDLAAKGNDFGISFSHVLGDTSITGQAGAFVRNVFCGETTVPSSNATLLDNYGVPPIEGLPPGICP